ncbi:SIMPL domain-containing protein [Caviibacter abscessus]|uniref:SIMPL domain-containing protein n=1 Tax=Caviibacter abscessus TaxID=1766719 RepID=UPI0008331DB0|nr:SIMPL domain-containing protein [Caviibacter abscessus]
MNKMSNIIVAIVLALGAIISMAIIANAIERNNTSNKTITVRGNAVKEFKIKEYSFDVSIYVNSKDINKAYDELFEKEQNIKNVLENGETYTESNVKAKANFKEGSSSVKDYEIYKTLTFNNVSIEKLNKIKESLDLLALQIKDITVLDIVNTYESETDDDKKELLSQAMKDAKNKAYTLVKANNHDLGDVRKILQGRFFKEKNKLSVIVTVVYEIN